MSYQAALLSERADRVPAFPAVEAEPAVAKFGELLPPDLLSCKHPRKHKAEAKGRGP